jgi:hypothetical protein
MSARSLSWGWRLTLVVAFLLIKCSDNLPFAAAVVNPVQLLVDGG